MFNIFKRKSTLERIGDATCDAGKTAAKVVGTAVVGTLYGIGAVAVAMGEVAAENERRRAEARKEAADARRAADEAERKAREAERRAYGSTVYSSVSSSDVVRSRTTSCNGVVYEIERRYNGMCKYTITVRRYYSGKVVRIEDTYAYTQTAEVERRFRDEIQRGYMD